MALVEFLKTGDLKWRRRAACATVENARDLFFPVKLPGRTGGAYERNRQLEDQALAICSLCPVLKECANYAIKERYGIWGGMNESTRDRFRSFVVRRNPAKSGDYCLDEDCDAYAYADNKCLWHLRGDEIRTLSTNARLREMTRKTALTAPTDAEA